MAKNLSLLVCHALVTLWVCCNYVGAEPEIGVYELKRGDLTVKLTNFGATLLSVVVPDKNGKLDDIALGLETVDEYKNDYFFFGSFIGRVFNRIKGAQFTLNGVTYKLTPNIGNNTIHGGFKGLTKVIYKVKSYKQDSHITFTYHSVDGEEGFPGDLQVSVTYSLPEPNKLEVKMKAKALNKPTPVSLGTHFYWNLGGHNSGDILSHSLQLFASRFTPLDIELIPTGEISPVQGTVYDFLQPHIIGSKMKELKGGYDMNYVVDNAGDGRLAKVAVVQESKSGRKMELWSTAPGVQFYTSNVMGGVKGKGGYMYGLHAGLCLEPQGFPNSVNQPNFPSQIVNPGDIYKHVMVFEFTANSN